MNAPVSREAVGPTFSLAAMAHARRQSCAAVQRIAAEVVPGMTEQQARDRAKDVLREMGMQRIWHPVIIRFGEATLKKYDEPSTRPATWATSPVARPRACGSSRSRSLTR